MSKNLNVRIVGKGSRPHEYEVYDADTGEKLDNVLSVDVRMSAADMLVTAEITVAGVELDVEAPADVEAEDVDRNTIYGDVAVYYTDESGERVILATAPVPGTEDVSTHLKATYLIDIAHCDKEQPGSIARLAAEGLSGKVPKGVK